MSQLIANLNRAKPGKRSRVEMLELVPEKKYEDGRTKQSFRDECDIDLIMQRAARGGTISHLNKYEGVYADYSDFDFFEHMQQLTKGREIFDDLPAEVRKEFGQSPAEFFAYVNDPANIKELATKLPALAAPGRQLPLTSAPSADEEAALAAASEPASKKAPVVTRSVQKPPEGEIKAPVAPSGDEVSK